MPMKSRAPSSLWKNPTFRRLYAAHATSLVGSGLGAVALGLLAHELVGASAPTVLGIALTIRIAVIVLLSPWAGIVAGRVGVKRSLIACDLLRVIVVLGFLAADNVWQIYGLAIFLNAGSALFTPIYKAAIPGVVGEQEYPRALAWGTVAYDTSNILGPALAGLVIVLVGFEGNFFLNACAFGVSTWLLLRVPRLALEADPQTASQASSPLRGLHAMLTRWPLRLSLLLAVQTSIAGALVLVGTIGLVKSELALGDAPYAWLMATYGAGSVAGAFLYAKVTKLRHVLRLLTGAIMTLALFATFWLRSYDAFLLPWSVLGAGQAILSICGNEILAKSTAENERTGIYAAHFALSHLGWGVFYPLAGWSVAAFGFADTALAFSLLLGVCCIPLWAYHLWIRGTHRHLPDASHDHSGCLDDNPTHPHRHGKIEHQHFHLHHWP